MNYDNEEAQKAAEDARKSVTPNPAPPSRGEVERMKEKEIEEVSDDGKCDIDGCDGEAVQLERYNRPRPPTIQSPNKMRRAVTCEDHNRSDIMKQEFELSVCDECGSEYYVSKMESRVHSDEGICVDCTLEDTEYDSYSRFLKGKMDERRKRK